MSNLIKHAEKEFELLGWPGDDDMQKLICKNILDLLKVVANQGHSGSSLPYLLNLFDALVKFHPIAPLTGADDEWNDISDMSEEPKWQNNRCSEVFKRADGSAYWIHGKVFKDIDGHCYTNRDSFIDITFPWAYTKPEIVQVGE